jgi:hypothetical protein
LIGKLVLLFYEQKSLDMLNEQRGILNEIEESLKEKKRKFKYEIMLSDEIKQLDYIENKVDN